MKVTLRPTRFTYFLLGSLLLTACAQTAKTQTDGRQEYDQHARLTNLEQVPGSYVMVLPEDSMSYHALMKAYVEGNDGGLPLEAVSWKGVPIQPEPNRAAVRYVASSAGRAISPLGSIEEMRIDERVAFVQLSAHLQNNALEIAIAEPIVRETLVAFDMIDRVEFKP